MSMRIAHYRLTRGKQMVGPLGFIPSVRDESSGQEPTEYETIFRAPTYLVEEKAVPPESASISTSELVVYRCSKLHQIATFPKRTTTKTATDNQPGNEENSKRRILAIDLRRKGMRTAQLILRPEHTSV